jgi:hypothetical protein
MANGMGPSSLIGIKKKKERTKEKNAVPLHAMVALGGRGGIAPTHS